MTHQITGCARPGPPPSCSMALTMVLTRVAVTAVCRRQAGDAAHPSAFARPGPRGRSADHVSRKAMTMDRISSQIIQRRSTPPAGSSRASSTISGRCRRPARSGTAGELTNHLVGGLQLFARPSSRGSARLSSATASDSGSGPTRLSSRYPRAAERDSAAWHQSAATDQIFELSIGQVPGELAAVIHLTEIVVHGADLAVATGRQDGIDEKGVTDCWPSCSGWGGVDGFRVPGVFGPAASAAPGGAARTSGCWPFSVDASRRCRFSPSDPESVLGFPFFSSSFDDAERVPWVTAGPAASFAKRRQWTAVRRKPNPDDEQEDTC